MLSLSTQIPSDDQRNSSFPSISGHCFSTVRLEKAALRDHSYDKMARAKFLPLQLMNARLMDEVSAVSFFRH